MSTYQTGTIVVRPTDAIIEGVGTKFLSFVKPGAHLTIIGSGMTWQIIEVIDDTHIRIVDPIPGLAGNVFRNLKFSISSDFGGGVGLPTPRKADITPHQLTNRALTLIDTYIPK